ncbi:hypothetical protein CCAX7_004850 [Capsulimonas corticalis]|uniref:Uncharacterized protein n=1 Tax=Capsulimonas corticalis TaxID=2219043 RepID=A0A402D2P9_9BACT|nr:permease prefix domain 1-containing protein [Capsulimonas corticalis]BDI28434.1 hypothetical protein CCAX7_004850 [Capsulimonas corticalis]
MDSRPDKEILDHQIEQYLTRVASYLYGASRQAVEDNLEEIRQHLFTGSEERIRAGLSADQAAQSAIQRFGSSDKIGASLARHLTPYAFPVRVYQALWVCQFMQYAACVLGMHQFFALPLWAAAAIVMCIYTLVLVLEEDRRFTVRSKSIAEFYRHIGRIQREMQRANIARIVNLSGSRRFQCLMTLALMSIGYIHEHAYGLLGLFVASVIEFVLIRRTASRIGANISA